MEIGKTSHMGLINPIDKCKIVSGFGTIKSNFTAIISYFIFPNRVKFFSD